MRERTLFWFIFVVLLNNVAIANIVQNGDFDNGEISPWSCKQVHCEVSQNFLSLTERSQQWAGPRQILNNTNFVKEKDLKVTFGFDLQANEMITATWKMKFTNGEESSYFSLLSKDFDNQNWENTFEYLTLPNSIINAKEIEFYLEVFPGSAEYNLDNVTLKIVNEENWEQEANERIEILRKRNVTIYLDSNNSNFLTTDDLTLKIEQKNQQFPFGTAVQSQRIADCYEDNLNDGYCSFVNENYNWMVDTYRMKWRGTEPVEGRLDTELPDKMIEWAHQYGKIVRGHALLWAKRSNNPDWVQNLYGEELENAIFNRLDFAVNHFNVPHWDVINEMVDEGSENHTFYMDQTGDREIRQKIFKYVKELSPNTLFFLNDYGIVMTYGGRFQLFQEQIRELLAAGAPIDAIGLQSHIKGTSLVDISTIKYHVEQLWKEFHLPIWITEFDWNADGSVDFGDHSVHAEQLQNFYRLMFSLEAVDGILTWHCDVLFDETKAIGIALDETTYLPNKAGEAYRKLIHEEWNTQKTFEISHNEVRYDLRGFMGDYNLQILQGTTVVYELEFNLENNLEIFCISEDSDIICN